MTLGDVVDDGRLYHVDFDASAAAGRRIRALVIARLVDEATGRPLTGPTTVTASLPHTTARANGAGIAGMLGVPADVLPKLAVQSYSFDLQVTAPGFIPRRVTITIPAQPSFPDTFVPARISRLLMRRVPLMIQGRIVQVAGTGYIPASGASVRVSGIWPDPVPTGVSTPAAAPDVVAVRAPLLADRPASNTDIRPRPLVPDPPSDTRIADPVGERAATITVLSAPGYGAGDIVILDADVIERREYATVASLVAGTSATGRTTLTLTFPAALPHRVGALVRRALPQAAGAPSTLSRNAFAGDPCVFAGGASTIASGTIVELSGGGIPPEFHDALAYQVIALSGGRYRLPPISRVSRVEIEADDGALAPVSRQVTPSLYEVDHHLDLVLS